MKDVDLYLKVRHAVRIEGLSERAAARRFGIDPRTVNKMMKFSVPPGYVRKKPPAKPKLDPFIPVIDRILGDDKSRPKKQLHTAKRIFERLRDGYGFTGGITIVKDYVAGWRQRAQEMFVPLVHPPGHAQADFGEAIGIIGGVGRAAGARPCRLANAVACALRRLREGGHDCLLAVAGALSAQRLLGADELRSPRCACARLPP